MALATVVYPGTSEPACQLFEGCVREAARADKVALHLEGVRFAIFNEKTDALDPIIVMVRRTAAHLRELADVSQVHQDRVKIVLPHLNLMLKCLQRSLLDMQGYVDDTSRTTLQRWLRMYHGMKDEDDGTELFQRFSAYNAFIQQLLRALNRSPDFDMNRLHDCQEYIMDLRDKRSIAPPTGPLGSLSQLNRLVFESDPTRHWAKNIFANPLSSRTPLEKRDLAAGSVMGGHVKLWGHTAMPPNSTVLFRRQCNEDTASLTALNAFHSTHGFTSSILLRSVKPETGEFWYSQHGCQDITIERDGPILRLMRWSKAVRTYRLWALLCMSTWEELILLYSALMVLKARNPRTGDVHSKSFKTDGETELFRGIIWDDEFRHSLRVYEDISTGGVRLLAVVSGPGRVLRNCPVWTAFVTQQSKSPTWIERVSSRRIRLRDVHIYSFCDEYDEWSQRRGIGELFELEFLCEKVCLTFCRLFPMLPRRSSTPRLTGK